MTFEQALASIEDRQVRYSIVSDADLTEWAQECILIFNNPPACEPVRLVEALGRQMADRLRVRINEHIPPSIYRLVKAFDRVLPDQPMEQRRQLAMWSEVILFYLSEGK